MMRGSARQIAAVAVLPPHPHLVGQYRAWQQGGHFYIQMELCTGGSLAHLLQAVRRLLTQLLPEMPTCAALAIEQASPCLNPAASIRQARDVASV